MRGLVGFNRRVSISVLKHNAILFSTLYAPKFKARAAGIESVCYDFPKGVLRTRDFFGYFLGKKVTSTPKF